MPSQAEIAPLPQYLWNHKCHQAWANEHLYFWRFGFSPRYNNPEILARIKTTMLDHSILSYAIYEMTGQHDLLVRLWLPPSVTHEDFETALRAQLAEVDLQTLDHFLVNNIVNHWVWDSDGIESLRLPPPEILKTRLSDADIRRINDGQITKEEFLWFSSKNLIASFKSARGIKFVVLVPPPPSLTVFARDHLRQLLKGILSKAQSVTEVSLYCGTGFGEFLLMGRIDPSRFNELNSQLLQPINEIGIGDLFGVRTFTHIVVTPPSDSRNIQDRLPLKDAVLLAREERELSDYLRRPEEEQLEFKGSAFIDLKAWLFTGNKPVPNDKLFTEGVLRAIVGQLNSKGGKVILGVLEADRFKEEAAQERLRTLPSAGDYLICGVNLEYGASGWDFFQRRLQDSINAKITPSPQIWVSIRKEEFEGKDVCVISVRPPVSDWFYLKDDSSFYVRYGNQTRPLNGPESDSYKRNNPR